MILTSPLLAYTNLTQLELRSEVSAAMAQA